MKANGLKMVSIRLVDDPPIYSEDKIQNPNDAVQLLLRNSILLTGNYFSSLT